MTISNNQNLRKNVIWNIIGSTFSSFNSLLFLIIVTRINGVDMAGIFSFAFSTACLFYIIGIYSGRTFQVTDNNKEINDSDYLNCKIVTCTIMFLVSIIFCMVRGYSFNKFIIIEFLVCFKMIEAYSESNYAVLQKFEKLYIVGISMFLKATTSLVCFLIIDVITKSITISCFSIFLCNLLVVLIYDRKNIKKVKFRLEKFNYKKVVYLLKNGFFSFGFAFLTLYLINAPKYAIDTLLSNNMQTIYGIISMPATILVLFGQFIIQPFLVKLKTSLVSDKSKFLQIIIKMIIIIVVFGFFCIIVCYFLGIPILELLYNIDLHLYKSSLIVIICGGIIYTITVVLSTALTTMRSTVSQFMTFLIVSVITLFLSHYFVLKMNIMGACIVYAISMIILLLLYIIIFIKKYLEIGEKYERN